MIYLGANTHARRCRNHAQQAISDVGSLVLANGGVPPGGGQRHLAVDKCRHYFTFY